MAKKPTTRIIEKGRIYITATFNNTLVTITDEKGHPVVLGSCGMYGFSGTRKSTPYAATITTEATIKKAIGNHNFREATVYIKGIGPGREAALRVIKGSNIEISKIMDITSVPHHGT